MCLSYLGLWAWEECVAFVRQTRYTNSWLTWALSRKKVELLLWANILNLCSAVLTKRKEKKNLFVMKDGWGSSPWICRGRRCHTREEHLPAEQTHIRVSCRLRGAGKHEDESDKSTNIRMGRDVNPKADTQTATAGADQKTSVPQELELAVRDQPDVSGVCAATGVGKSAPSAASCSARAQHHLTQLRHRRLPCHRCVSGFRRWAEEPGQLQQLPTLWWQTTPPQSAIKTAAAGVALVVCPHSEHQVVHSTSAYVDAASTLSALSEDWHWCNYTPSSCCSCLFCSAASCMCVYLIQHSG